MRSPAAIEPGWWAASGAAGVLLGLGLGGLVSASADPWKACAFNDQVMGCRDVHHANGSLTIHWQDGVSMTYRLIEEGFPWATLRDSLGGVWQREVLVQGNAVFTHAINGNRIVVPLR